MKEKERKAHIRSISYGNKGFESRKVEMRNIADIIKMYYARRGVSNIFLVKVVDHIRTKNKKIILNSGKFLILCDR